MLLRNPVDRAYSDYQHKVRERNETLSFEEAIEAEEERIRGEEEKLLADYDYFSRDHRRYSYFSRGIYVDQLARWYAYFDPAQMLVLKSEEFFEDTQKSLKSVFRFLELPEHEIEASGSRNKGRYTEKLSPALRRRLGGYFEPVQSMTHGLPDQLQAVKATHSSQDAGRVGALLATLLNEPHLLEPFEQLIEKEPLGAALQ